MEAIIGANVVISGHGSFTLEELTANFQKSMEARAPVASPLVLASDNALELIGGAAWLAESLVDGLILPAERLTSEIVRNLSERGYYLANLSERKVIHPQSSARPRTGRICLLTSGTTGTPKIIEHTWKTLFTMSRVHKPKPLNWLVTYQAGTYAWYQIITLALFAPNQSLTLSVDRSPSALIEAALNHGVTAISGTPTFWRMALAQFPLSTLRHLDLQQITLGGERVDQSILDRLKLLYPAASVIHIYASSEAGACIVVRDGQEGFPTSWLAESGDLASPCDRPLIQVRDGFLWIHSPHAAVGQAGWINSGDTAEIRGDRVVILGRADGSIINVGGIKISACDVESRILAHPSVIWCRVYGQRAPFAGELVASDAVFGTHVDAVSERELVEFCARSLPEYMIPRIWNFLDSIPVTENLKTIVR